MCVVIKCGYFTKNYVGRSRTGALSTNKQLNVGIWYVIYMHHGHTCLTHGKTQALYQAWYRVYLENCSDPRWQHDGGRLHQRWQITSPWHHRIAEALIWDCVEICGIAYHIVPVRSIPTYDSIFSHSCWSQTTVRYMLVKVDLPCQCRIQKNGWWLTFPRLQRHSSSLAWTGHCAIIP